MDCVCKMAERSRVLGIGPERPDEQCEAARAHRKPGMSDLCNERLDAFKTELRNLIPAYLEGGVTIPAVCQ